MSKRVWQVERAGAAYLPSSWRVLLTNLETGETWRCGHSHKSEALAVKCQAKWKEEEGE
jgi:hypothetical protein